MKNSVKIIDILAGAFLLTMGGVSFIVVLFRLASGLLLCGPFRVIGGESGPVASDIHVSCTSITNSDLLAWVIMGAIFLGLGFLVLKNYIFKKNKK